MARNTTHETLCPVHVVPDHFFCNQSSTIVVVYEHPLGEEENGVTLIFPGDMPGSAPRRIIPQRLGRRALLFDTPVYTSSGRGMLEVLPLLSLPSGEVELPPFRIGLRHPIRNITELCLNLSTRDAVLPVLMALMVHCNPADKAQLQDPHIDRIMATLAGSRTLGANAKIKDIMLPSRKWKGMTMSEFAREFQFREMEKQTAQLATPRWKFMKSKKTDYADMHVPATGEPKHNVHSNYVNLSPLSDCMEPVAATVPRSAVRLKEAAAKESVGNTAENLKQEAEILCEVVEDFRSPHPERLNLKSGQKVYVVRRLSSGRNWWYGVCEDKQGYFPAKHVRRMKKLKTMETPTEFKYMLGTCDSLRLGAQPIKDMSDLQKPLRQNVVSDSEETGSRLQVPPPNLLHLKSLSKSTDTGLDSIHSKGPAEPFHPDVQVPRKISLQPPGSAYPQSPLAQPQRIQQTLWNHRDMYSSSDYTDYDDVIVQPQGQKVTSYAFSANELALNQKQEPPLSHHSSERPQGSRHPVPLPRPRRFLYQGERPSRKLPPTKNGMAINGLQLPSMHPTKPLPTSVSTPHFSSPPPGGVAENGCPEPWGPEAALVPPRNGIQHSKSGEICYSALLRKGGHAKKDKRNNSVESYGSNDSGFITDADNKSHV